MARPVVRWLERTIRQDWRVFEFGAGLSTPWLARRCAGIVSVESDPDWYHHVSLELKEEANCTLVLGGFLETIVAQPKDSLDLVIVDGSDREVSRVACVDAAMSQVRSGGYLLLDDSDRPQYAPVSDLLASWHVRRITAMKALPFKAVQSAIYRRPA